MHRFPFPPSTNDRLQLRMVGFLSIFTVLVGGCTTTASSQLEVPMTNAESAVEESAPELIPVVRYGRYTLVELTPQAAQHNLLLQVVDVSMPSTQHVTVEDGLSYVLQRSGYSLCDDDPEATDLYELPLPAAHLQLGPIFLRDALLTLAGPAWELQVDDRARRVCFTPNLKAQP